MPKRPPGQTTAPHAKPKWPMRLNKYVAHCGICSRRQAAEYVKQGLVTVDGEVIIAPGYEVEPDQTVTYRGEVITPEERLVYILLNKPKGYITTKSDERGRRTVMDLLQGAADERIFPVGRLDRNTTGLLLFTNDGDTAKRLTHPRYKVSKIYAVRLDRFLLEEDLQRVRNTIILEDGPAPVIGVNYVEGQPKNQVGIELQIGRNRIVRRIFEHMGYTVDGLDRTYFAGLTKKDLPRGKWRHLTPEEVRMLRYFGG